MTPTTDLGLSIRLSMFELRETGDWGIFLFFFWDDFWDDFSQIVQDFNFFLEIGQGLLLHFWSLCTLINPFLEKNEKKLIFLKSDN